MLSDFLIERRSKIISKWADLIIATYPDDAAKFIKNEQDRFANPIGHRVAKGAEGMLDALLAGRLSAGGEAGDFLDDLVRLRAVQDFTPAQALAFLFALKQIIRGELLEANSSAPNEELSAFDARIDRLALSAFDIYARCREQLFEIRINQMKRENHVILERFNRMTSSKGGQTTEENEELAQDPKKVMP
jgi:hypothetical protein